MVNKQVEKRIADLHSEFLLKTEAPQEEMNTKVQEQLRELAAKEASDRFLYHSKLDQEPNDNIKVAKEI